MDEKYSSTEVEVLDAQKKATKPVVGDITLFDEDGGIILIPTPTNNPNDPLNLPTWRKYLILLIVGLFAGTANLMASGAGVLMPFFMREYRGDHKASDLATWPAFYMGVGNLLAIPVAHAVGRRPVYLIATVLLAFGCLWCAKSQSLGSHIAGRNVMSIAAGQAEALCPIIVQEIFYLHQRGRIIAYFCALQTLGTASLFVASSYIGNNLGWRWWYGIFGIANGAIALLSILFVVESKFFRSITALSGQGVESDDGTLVPVTTNTKRRFDTTNFAPRSFLRDMRPWSGKAEWSEAITCWKQMFQIIWFPNILWLILTNSIGLGIYVIMTTTFAEVLVKPPFAWGFDALGYVFAGQVATAIAIPFFCGTLSDWMTKFFSKRNGGVTHPEYRLLATIIPLTAILISTFIYGQTAQHPEKWTWAGIVVTLNVEYFGFVGVIVSAFVYCMDAYPQRIDAALVLICALRGFIGFAISEGTVSFIKNNGYDGAYNICGGIVAATMVLGIPVYFFGGKIRAFTARWGQDDEQQK